MEKTMTNSMNFVEAKKAAEKVIKDLLASGQEWPEDTWYSIGSDWDLNLYEFENVGLAAIYPVKDGRTYTNKPITIDVEAIRKSLEAS
jgi:hypothetical protein